MRTAEIKKIAPSKKEESEQPKYPFLADDEYVGADNEETFSQSEIARDNERNSEDKVTDYGKSESG
jgi:hypothetical protein